MSLIKLSGLNDITEARMPPEGAYPLVVARAVQHTKKGESESSSVMIALEIEDAGDENYSDLLIFNSWPREGDSEQAIEFKLLQWKRFLYYMDLAHMIEGEEVDLEEMVGARSIIDIPVSIDPPSEDNGNREGRNVNFPPLPTEE